MFKKTWHVIVVILAIVGAVAVVHIYMQHPGQNVIPGLGSK